VLPVAFSRLTKTSKDDIVSAFTLTAGVGLTGPRRVLYSEQMDKTPETLCRIKWLSKREAATAPGQCLENKSDVIRSVVHGGREICADRHKHYM
jgi:hypothetical protein